MSRLSSALIFFLASIGWHFAVALQFPLPPSGEDIVGEIQIATVRKGDTLLSIAQRYGVVPQEIMEANPTLTSDMSLIPGMTLIIPTYFILPKIRDGIVVNLAELRLYYFPKDQSIVYTYPVGIGRQGWRTPVATTYVISKHQDPAWYVPRSIKEYVLHTQGKLLPDVVPAGPDNPLGKYALRLALPGYLIHGTNDPLSIGKQVSSGCIRMSAEGIETLFREVPINTPVHIIYESVKVGWSNKLLYLEAQQPILDYSSSDTDVGTALHLISKAQVTSPYTLINWPQVSAAIIQRDGVPTLISFE